VVEVIPTLRRSRDDVFLIGEEQILTDPDPDPTIATRVPGGSPSRRSRSPHLPSSLRGAGGLAALGLVAAVPLLLLALRTGGGQGPARQTGTPSPRTPLISRSAASVPARAGARSRPRASRKVEVPPRSVHHRRSRHPKVPVPRKVVLTQSEPEREPTEPVAPVSSPAVMPTPSTTAPEVTPQPTAEPTPPGPPPSSSGGGPAGVETFGFER
jgi:hypothetical protein